MITRMRNDGGHEGDGEPQPHCSKVRSHQQWSSNNRSQVGYQVFNWVGIDSHNPYRGGPLMMLFMDIFVDRRMVEQPVRDIKRQS